ncbi:MAG TPA: type I secretion system permease/ATPase [Methylomusa anaerophila]|nr:type I secretion system permease/ATPase [Methylomusa anaerophila]HML88616.1 type I secretion system permease/ATPase [Methylomusa anaerophila]
MTIRKNNGSGKADGEAGFDSGLECLLMIAGVFHIPVQRDSLREPAKLSGGGMTNAAIIKAARSLRLKAAVEKPKPQESSPLPSPSIARLKDGSYVLLGRNDRGRVFLFLPQGQNVVVAYEEFVQKWSGELIVFTPMFSWSNFSRKYNLQWFTSVIMHYKKYFAEVIAASFFLQLFGLLTPLFTQVVVDKVLGNRAVATLDILAGALVFLYLFQSAIGVLRTYLLTHTTNKLDVILGVRLFRQLVALPLPYFENRRVGDTMMRIGALASVRDFLTGQSITYLLDAFFAVIFILVMLYYSVPLTLLALLTLPVFLAMNYYATPVYKQRLEATWETGAENNAFLVEAVTGMHTIKSLALEPQFNHRWEQLLARYVRTTFDQATFGIGISNASTLIQMLSGFSILWFGGHLVMEGRMTLGQLIAFQMLAGQATAPIMHLVAMWQSLQQAGLSMERLGDILNNRPEPVLAPVNSQLPPVKGEIVLENVNFRYRMDFELVLKDIQLRIPAGSRVGIVGRSGSGKSTLTKLVQRLYAPETGRITVDGVNITEVEPPWLRRQIGVVMQENYLFNGSVRDNIAVARPGASMEEVIRAARTAGAHDFILELPEGYDTKVGERGASLSGGQCQRIAIARALLTNPKILIFDEATSALDYESERIIMENLEQIAAGRTMLMIAHRLSTVRRCDSIIVIEEGRIVEQGSHEELMAAQGLYQKLYAQQER